ncbi:MAG: methyltransferase domain-containing protein [archaeon]
MNTLLVDKNGKKIFRNISPETNENTEYGIIRQKGFNKRAGKLKTHSGYEFDAYETSLLERVETMKMGARPIYPYDSGVMCALLSVRPGAKVLEAGTGSGGNALFMAELGANVDSFEAEKRFFEIAQKNLRGYENVRLKNADVTKAKLKKNSYDVIFLDLQNPSKALEKTFYSLKKGGFAGVYSPIMDDIKPVWRTMERLGFMNIRAIQLSTLEIIVKKYARVKGLLGFPGFFVWARKK